jgi:hypothetical protein
MVRNGGTETSGSSRVNEGFYRNTITVSLLKMIKKLATSCFQLRTIDMDLNVAPYVSPWSLTNKQTPWS